MLAACILGLSLVCDDSSSGSKQIEFTSPTPLLSSNGALASWGWARRAILTYNRDAIPAERLGRLKEWEHYTVMSPDFTVGITIAQLGSLAFGSVELIDYHEKYEVRCLFANLRSKDRSVFPANPYGATELRHKDDGIFFRFEDGRRFLSFDVSKSAVGPSFAGTIQLIDNPKEDSIAITRPFDEAGQFFYENKIFGMPAEGSLRVGEKSYSLPAGQAFAIFDWGRGVWPRESQWFWGQAAGRIGDQRVAINLGHGYGDDSRGTANAILVDGKLHKLGVVSCEYDPADRMKPWKLTSDDDRVSLTFQPTYHQESKQNLGFAAVDLHKIHGYFSGSLIVDGQEIPVQNLLGFAEHMNQRW